MNAVLLAGGRGKRLRPLTDTLPKPLVPIADKPILQWQIEWLRGCGVSSFMLSVGYLPDQIRSHFGDGRKYGVEIQYIVEHEPLGTAGALRKALEESGIDSPVFVANGDVLTNLDPKEAEARRDEQGLVGSICLVPLPSPYGIVDVDGDRIVRSFREKPVLSDYWINAGVYALAPEI
ncbi:MAG: nucleotidyltransferase family protein, partial [Dehalococcoidia bacterium]